MVTAPGRQAEPSTPVLMALPGISKHVVERIGPIVEVTQMLELEAQHQGAVRPNIKPRFSTNVSM